VIVKKDNLGASCILIFCIFVGTLVLTAMLGDSTAVYDKPLVSEKPLVVLKESLPDMIDRLSKSCVMVDCTVSRGSGVFIDDNVVLTAGHVVDSYREGHFGYVLGEGGKKHMVIGSVRDPYNDCGLLYIMGKSEHWVELQDLESPRAGTAVISITTPVGMEELLNTASLGIVAKQTCKIGSMFGPGDYLLIDNEGNPGCSGGPVFDLDGRLIGIVVGTYSGYGNGIIVTPANICARIGDGDETVYEDSGNP